MLILTLMIPLKDPQLVRERFGLVSRLNADRDRKSSALHSHPKLSFKSSPNSPVDPPGLLDDTMKETTQFLDYYTWLNDQLSEHGNLPPVGHKDADNRYTAEVEKIRDEVRRLDRLRVEAWNRLVYAKFTPLVHDGGEPMVMRPSSSFAPIAGCCR